MCGFCFVCWRGVCLFGFLLGDFWKGRYIVVFYSQYPSLSSSSMNGIAIIPALVSR